MGRPRFRAGLDCSSRRSAGSFLRRPFGEAGGSKEARPSQARATVCPKGCRERAAREKGAQREEEGGLQAATVARGEPHVETGYSAPDVVHAAHERTVPRALLREILRSGVRSAGKRARKGIRNRVGRL